MMRNPPVRLGRGIDQRPRVLPQPAPWRRRRGLGGRRAHLQGHRGDWGRFPSVLGGTGYQGSICIEAEDRAYEKTLESRKEALRQAARYLRGFLPETP